MRALYSNNRGEIYIKEVPEPTLQGSGVVIRTLASVFGAGSEMAGVGRRRKALQEGQDPGAFSEKAHSYQSAGEILQVSPDLQDRFQPGDLVAAAGGGFGFHAEQGLRVEALVCQDSAGPGAHRGRNDERWSHGVPCPPPRGAVAGRDGGGARSRHGGADRGATRRQVVGGQAHRR